MQDPYYCAHVYAGLRLSSTAHTLVHISYLNFSQIYCFSALKMSKIETIFPYSVWPNVQILLVINLNK